MDSYSKAAVERAMKVQEVMLRAMAKKITWWQAAEESGLSMRTLQYAIERGELASVHVGRRRLIPAPEQK